MIKVQILPFSIGFTGTRNGMTYEQKRAICECLELYLELGYREVHHGMCIGADADFHELAASYSFIIHGHPGVNRSGKCNTRADLKGLFIYKEEPFIVRDKHIVNQSTLLMATPATPIEELRSGTWATIRYARMVRKFIIIVNPDGSIKKEN